MITAIAMQEGIIDSRIDKHFGKCACFLILDENEGNSEIIENPARTMRGCKADVIVNTLTERGVSRVIAGDFGSNMQQLLNKREIQMIIHPDENVTVSEVAILLTAKGR